MRKLINVIGGILIVGALSYCTHNCLSAEGRVRSVCNHIKPGMTVEQLRQFVLSRGMTPEPMGSEISFVVETKTFGRYGCKAISEGGYVKESKYNFSD
jgi:hypothetical protein